jgi:transposase
MKVDGRTLDHTTLEQIRLMTIQRVREGEEPAAVIASFGFCRTTIYKWMRLAAGRGRGLKALSSTRGTGRPRSLTPAQERQVFRWVNGRDPRQYGLDFGLWTRAIVAMLIEQKFGIDLGVTAVGALLAKLELTPQKPLQRAYQRDPDPIALWQSQTYPALARQAKRDKAEILFWDELGFRADTEHGKTWGLRGQTAIVHLLGNANRCRLPRRSVPVANSGFVPTLAV